MSPVPSTGSRVHRCSAVLADLCGEKKVTEPVLALAGALELRGAELCAATKTTGETSKAEAQGAPLAGVRGVNIRRKMLVRCEGFGGLVQVCSVEGNIRQY